MSWYAVRERVVLAGLGVLAVIGLGLLMWQRQQPPLVIEARPAEGNAWDQALERARRVDVNTADHAELGRLPEVGPALARRIVEYRAQHGEFQRVEDLAQVPGIGPKTIEAIKDYVTIQ